MVNDRIRGYLKAAFNPLPVVDDVGQTKTVQSVSFNIEAEIKVNIKKDSHQDLIIPVTVFFRSENGYEAIGYLSHKIANAPRTSEGLTVDSVEAAETIEYVEKTQIILSKNIIVHIRANYDEVREVIKSIELEITP
jgi:hypothetical protein